jgi:hypothetical protein
METIMSGVMAVNSDTITALPPKRFAQRPWLNASRTVG